MPIQSEYCGRFARANGAKGDSREDDADCQLHIECRLMRRQSTLFDPSEFESAEAIIRHDGGSSSRFQSGEALWSGKGRRRLCALQCSGQPAAAWESRSEILAQLSHCSSAHCIDIACPKSSIADSCSNRSDEAKFRACNTRTVLYLTARRRASV